LQNTGALKFDTGFHGFRGWQARDLWKHAPVEVSGDAYAANRRRLRIDDVSGFRGGAAVSSQAVIFRAVRS